jgi:NAD(P)-dependent dehydrogenase (short-subunit alcohol dehydrogenase family)
MGERQLNGTVVLITGAARGQGRSHAVRLAEEGVAIIAVDIAAQISTVPYPLATPEDLDQTVKEVRAAGGEIVAVQADVRDFDALRDAVDQGVAEFGRLDHIVANAAVAPHSASELDPIAVFIDTVMTNLVGVRHTVHAGVDLMIEQGTGGSIVLISSTQGLPGAGVTGRVPWTGTRPPSTESSA